MGRPAQLGAWVTNEGGVQADGVRLRRDKYEPRYDRGNDKYEPK